MTDPPDRSAKSDELGVPTEPPDPAEADHVLPPEDLRYPTLTLPEGTVSPTDGTSLRGAFDRGDIQSMLRDLDAALTSHDLCVEGPDRRVTFGLGPGSVDIEFDPDTDHVGELSIRIDLKARAMVYHDADSPHVGQRGELGFIPKGMLTGDIDPTSARCYNWIEDPTAPLDDGD